jgi:hypothetical protein
MGLTMPTDEELMDDFFDTTSYDRTTDWRLYPELGEDPDETGDDEPEVQDNYEPDAFQVDPTIGEPKND